MDIQKLRINLEHKIGEGKYREVFAVNGYCIKKLKKYRKKKIGPFNLNLNAKKYVLFKFYTDDINNYEFKIYKKFIKKVPNKLKANFAEIEGIMHNGESYLVQETVKDNNKDISKTLAEEGKVGNSYFWEKVRKIENFLIENRIRIYDVNSTNMMVKKVSNEKFEPVIINYKRFGTRSYFLQPWIFYRKGHDNKTIREFSRLYKNHIADMV